MAHRKPADPLHCSCQPGAHRCRHRVLVLVQAMTDAEMMRQIRTPTAKEAFEQIIALRGYAGPDQSRVSAYAVCADVAEKGLKALSLDNSRKPESQIVPDDPEQGANETGISEKSFQKGESLFRKNENIAPAHHADAVPTPAQLQSACLSFRHDYGLLPPETQKATRTAARNWLEAWQREFRFTHRTQVANYAQPASASDAS